MHACHVCGGKAFSAFCEKNRFKIYRCVSCDLRFVHPIPESTADVYGQEYFTGAAHGFGYVSYDEDKKPMIPVFKKYLEHAKSALGRVGTLLDVGAATGFFVRLAKEAGFNAKGIELSTHAAAEGRKSGLDIQAGTLSDISGTFDCVTMLDVIEHVSDPRAELTRAATLLPKGGVLLINTPDAGSFTARLLGKRWFAIVPPEHLYYFNRTNLSRLLNECGFDVTRVTVIGKSFTLKYIFKTLSKWTGLSLFGALSRFFSRPNLSRLSLPLDLHDNMFLVAKRR